MEDEEDFGELNGKVLVAKVGMEDEFRDKFNEIAHIAQGTLGWRGQAEMMVSLEICKSLGVDPADPKAIELTEQKLKQVFLQSLMDVAEWIPEEEAEKRHKTTEVLFGNNKAEG